MGPTLAATVMFGGCCLVFGLVVGQISTRDLRLIAGLNLLVVLPTLYYQFTVGFVQTPPQIALVGLTIMAVIGVFELLFRRKA